MRVLAVAEIESLLEVEAKGFREGGGLADLGDVEVRGIVHGNFGEGVGDGRVIGGGGGKGLLGEHPMSLQRELAIVFKFDGDGFVVGGRGDDGDILKVFGRRANHGGSANVDVLDELLEVHAGLAGGLFKGVEIDHQHINGLDAMFTDGSDVRGIGAHVQNASVNLGVESFDAAVEHFGEAGEVADIAHGETGVTQHSGGASGGDQFNTLSGEPPGKFDQACFVGNAQDGTFNFRHDSSLDTVFRLFPEWMGCVASRAVLSGLELFAGAGLELHLTALY